MKKDTAKRLDGFAAKSSTVESAQSNLRGNADKQRISRAERRMLARIRQVAGPNASVDWRHASM